MEGTILDFLKLAGENEALTKDLVNLATKYDFRFSDELGDEDLDAVAGGLTKPPSTVIADGGLSNTDLQDYLAGQQETVETLSSISKTLHDTTLSIIKTMG